ncbi:MAG: hypothetical protein R3315_01435 [Woeseiaceae bacterium]|nr:hypothetical protein [Woeseiaceae bacterium]
MKPIPTRRQLRAAQYDRFEYRPLGLAAAALVSLFMAAPAVAHETADAIAVDGVERSERLIGQQVSANEARRAAYRYLGELGYSRYSNVGAARVRSITREGDTWIVNVAYSTGGRVMSRQATLFVDADTALVSERAPDSFERRVANR